jgi:L,D-peptidoglycan transpeptidase YkuD (ErfK/YbiS/YcfS/YnhG family)
MKRDDRLYDACLVLDWNIAPRRRGRGSAIFFHLARPGFTPTQGCVAVSRRAMARLLPHLGAGTVVKVVR